ncbi:hypothetical protein ruthe_00509 [Rubellimicrobium thermophilum DSM 16684]|uniref:C-deglycosylation enzyme beta subunit n=1 Tax=Rubellimicrobium thermophilum DSM 16684 TaxID=1123069 RepID=S9SLY7_9RHOB|nr:DUF6379 domain-containing protein [Rubellimicrobium thermophilum]EPX87439.1 hypothetical protein ruthe_00509 [Rubellimicrobium thermophilum DSM 16684]
MFERFFVREDSLRNVVKDGRVRGFCLAVKNANYRGVYLSLHNGYFLEVDGVNYPREAQSFAINGLPPRSFAEIARAVHEHWDYPDEGILHVACPGGLAPGRHRIRIQQSVLAAYGYRPTDEEWVRTPPVPGSGAGSDKAPDISEFMLELQGEEVVA